MQNSDKVHNEEMFNCSKEIEKFKCKKCPNFQTNFLAFFKNHIINDHRIKRLEEEVYTCLKCSFVTYSKYLEVRHSFFCENTTRSEDERRKFQFLFHKDREDALRFQSGQCSTKLNAKSNSKSAGRSRPAASSDVGWVHCDQCSYKCKTRLGNMKRHVLFCHTRPEEINWFECEHCHYRSKQMGNLRRHIKQFHLKPEDIQWFKCAQCRYKSKLKDDVKKHLKYVHSKPEDMPSIRCAQCPSKFKRNGDLMRHVRVCHGKMISFQA